jgi:ABC-type branched-subunit amino acid transport system ATPase component
VTRVLEVTDLGVRKGGRWILRHLSFAAESGEILLITGENGAGKSTLLDCLSGLEAMNEGVIALGSSGDAVYRSGQFSKGLAPAAAAGVRRSWQSVRLLPRLTLEEHVILAGQRCEDFIDVFSEILASRSLTTEQAILDHVKVVRASELSFGEAKLLQSAIALASASAIVLLDEPFAGLDDAKAALLRALIKRRTRKAHVAILVVEHRSNFRALAGFAAREIQLGIVEQRQPRRQLAPPAWMTSGNREIAVTRTGDVAFYSSSLMEGISPAFVEKPDGLSEQQSLLFDGIVAGLGRCYRTVCAVAPNGFGKTTLLFKLSSPKVGVPRVRFLPISSSALSAVRVRSLLKWSGAKATGPMAVWTSRRVGTLSGGERKRVELAASLLGDRDAPDVVALDEPSTSLDEDGIGFVESCVRKAVIRSSVLAMEAGSGQESHNEKA